MRLALIGVVAMLVSCSGGSSSTTSEASSTTSEASFTSTVTEIELAYKVGDTGPGGGIIVYVDKAGFNNSSGDDTSIGAMCLTGTCHYLEMAPTDLEDGYTSTEAINAAENYSTATADDWVLPSKDALNAMCKYAFGDTVNSRCNNRGVGGLSNSVGGFSDFYYWSSSQRDSGDAWLQNFDGGNQYNGSGGAPYYVRPVRAF